MLPPNLPPGEPVSIRRTPGGSATGAGGGGRRPGVQVQGVGIHFLNIAQLEVRTENG